MGLSDAHYPVVAMAHLQVERRATSEAVMSGMVEGDWFLVEDRQENGLMT